MSSYTKKIAVRHDSPDVVALVRCAAADSGHDCIVADSTEALTSLLNETYLAAVVLDAGAPGSLASGLIERIGLSASRPLVVALTDLETTTVGVVTSLAARKNIDVHMLSAAALDREALASCFGGCKRGPLSFTAADLRDSIEGGHVVAEYQPKVPFDPALETYAVEVLCRIRHPSFGWIYPDHFIGLAEKNGLIAELTDEVVRQSFSAWRKWFEHGLTLGLAINVSPELLDSGAWSDRFLSRCAEFGVPPEYITLEITESSSKAASETALDILTRLKLKGLTLSIDDFGTGFSSLATLYRLPFSELKIDKSFTMEFDQDPAARSLIESTVEMAQRLGLKVTAEGVETDSTFAQLRLIGCDDAQGYLISKSLPAEEIPAFFAAWRRTRGVSADGRPGFMPKLAAIQTLLNEAVGPANMNQTLVLSPTQCLAPEAPSLEVIAAIPPLVLQGRSLLALAACHNALQMLKARHEHAGLRKQVLELQRLLEYQLLRREDLVLSGGAHVYHLQPRRSALIGRPSTEKQVDVVINCRWFSRGERNLYLHFDGDSWFIEDLGSTNGSAVGRATLTPGSPIAVPFGRTLVEIGRSQGHPAPLSLCLSRSSESGEAVAITVIAGDESDPATWPTRDQDLETTWVIFRGELSMGSEEYCAVKVADSAARILADIRFQNGFWIAPRAGVPLTVDGVRFENPVPLVVGTALRVGSTEFQVELGSRRIPAGEKRGGNQTNNVSPLRAGGLGR